MKRNATRAIALAVVVLLAGAVSAQTPIDDIQVYDAAIAPASPYAGQTVTIEGVIYVVKGTYNSGTHYIQAPPAVSTSSTRVPCLWSKATGSR